MGFTSSLSACIFFHLLLFLTKHLPLRATLVFYNTKSYPMSLYNHLCYAMVEIFRDHKYLRLLRFRTCRTSKKPHIKIFFLHLWTKARNLPLISFIVFGIFCLCHAAFLKEKHCINQRMVNVVLTL